MTTLTGRQRHRLRALAHTLRPVILVGAGGLSDGLVAETERALTDHALIKVRLAGERAERRAQAEALCQRTGAELVQLIGRMAVLYRPSDKTPLEF